MKNEKTRAACALIAHISAAALAIMAVSFFFTRDTLSVLGIEGTTCFRYFTIDSNILAAVSCIAMIPYDVRMLKGSKPQLSAWIAKLRYVGA